MQAPDPARPLDRFVDATVAFKKIPALYPGSALVPRAWGQAGDCYLQMATLDSAQYENATNAYYQVLASAADVSARSMAEFGIALALEKMAKASKSVSETATLLDAAFGHYANLIYGKNLREGESPDAFWLEKAGLAAGKLAESRKQWDEAIHLYNRLLERLQPLRDLLEKRINSAREQSQTEKN